METSPRPATPSAGSKASMGSELHGPVSSPTRDGRAPRSPRAELSFPRTPRPGGSKTNETARLRALAHEAVDHVARPADEGEPARLHEGRAREDGWLARRDGEGS